MVAEDPPVPFLALVPPSAVKELPQRLTHHLRAVRPLPPVPAPASRLSEAIDGREAGLVNRNRNGFHMGTMIAELLLGDPGGNSPRGELRPAKSAAP